MANTATDADAAGSQSGCHRIVGGFTTLAVCVLAYLAFDDITTDNTISFTFECICLCGCALWCLFMATRLIRRGKHLLAAGSLLMLAGTVWGRREIGPGTIPSWQPEYVVAFAGLLWFLLLSAILVVLGFRVQRQERQGSSVCP